MNRFLITISAVLITLSGFSITATKEYVDRMIGSATNALDAAKRDKSDRAVYSVTRTENTDWVWTSDNAELAAALNAEGIKIKFNDENTMWNAVADPSGWAFAPAPGTKSDLSVVMYFIKGPEWIDQYPATATRPRYMDETLGTAKQDQQIAAVATDDAAKPANGSLMKYDAANDRFVKATAGTDYADKADILATNKEVDKAKSSANEAKATANEAKTYSVATYNFMNGNTNAWFAGTNYVFGADATNKHHFAFEDGMDIPSMPCSMALWENRDGIRQNVWDQRDWVSWYWSFKAGQMRREIAATNAEIRAAMTNYAPRAWSKMTAATGLENPDRSTTWIDTKNVTLSPGMAWETVATVDGCGYWTIVGNGAVIGGSGTNAVLTIRDFEGNDIMTVTKGEHRLAWLESSDFTGQSMDANNWVCFDMRADVQPTGYYSTTLEMADFVPETDAGCPAQYRWENMGGGIWRVHFLLKPGIVSASCFAKFQVEVEGQTIIRYNAGQEISGGLIYNGVKIAPDISGHPAVGTVIQWKVVN